MYIKKQPGVISVRVRETRRRLFEKCLLKVTVTKYTNTYQDGHLCDGLNALIYGTVHRVQSIWDTNISTKIGVFYSWTQKTISTRSIALECFGMFAIYGYLELILVLIVIISGHCLSWKMVMEWPDLCKVGRVTQGDTLDMVAYGIGILPLIKRLK